jgi:hypothetical protein
MMRRIVGFRHTGKQIGPEQSLRANDAIDVLSSSD